MIMVCRNLQAQNKMKLRKFLINMFNKDFTYLIGTGFFILLCVSLLIITISRDHNSTLEVTPTKHAESNPSVNIDDISFANNILIITKI